MVEGAGCIKTGMTRHGAYYCLVIHLMSDKDAGVLHGHPDR
jgi:hypothetical protein